MIGYARLAQFRVKKGSCEINPKFVNERSDPTWQYDCYGEYDNVDKTSTTDFAFYTTIAPFCSKGAGNTALLKTDKTPNYYLLPNGTEVSEANMNLTCKILPIFKFTNTIRNSKDIITIDGNYGEFFSYYL